MASKIRIHAVSSCPPSWRLQIDRNPALRGEEEARRASDRAMSLVILEVDMGRTERKIAKDLIMKIPGVVDVDVHETGHVAIIGTADAATLKETLEARLRRPVVVLADHRAVPSPAPTYGYGEMPPPPGAVYRRTPFGGIPSQDARVHRGPVVFGVNMGVRCPRSEKEAKMDLMKIPGVMEVCASLVTGHVAVIGMADAATLARLENRLSRPAVLIADFGAAPAPLMGGRYGMVPPPSFAFPAPMAMMGGGHHPYEPPVAAHYNPYVGYHQPRYTTPSPVEDYCYTPFGPPYMPEDRFEDEHHNGCCCSIQ